MGKKLVEPNTVTAFGFFLVQPVEQILPIQRQLWYVIAF